MKFKFQCPEVKFYGGTAVTLRARLVCGLSPGGTAEPSGRSSDRTAHNARDVYYLALDRKNFLTLFWVKDAGDLSEAHGGGGAERKGEAVGWGRGWGGWAEGPRGVRDDGWVWGSELGHWMAQSGFDREN